MIIQLKRKVTILLQLLCVTWFVLVIITIKNKEFRIKNYWLPLLDGVLCFATIPPSDPWDVVLLFFEPGRGGLYCQNKRNTMYNFISNESHCLI